LERAVSDETEAIAAANDAIATAESEIQALDAAIKALDKSVAEATAQRKAEHEAHLELMATNSAAKDLLNYAINRLNKFYNPKLYKAPAAPVYSDEDRIFVAQGGTPPPTPAPGGIAGTGIGLVQLHSYQDKVAPPPTPETSGPIKTKHEENSGVIEMIKMLITDLEKGMTESETMEKDGQADYQVLMRDSAEQRTLDSKTLVDKQAAKAAAEGELQAHKGEKHSRGLELAATNKYMALLHAECDWLIKYFDARREARSSEVSALLDAKAVLSGAGYSLLQMAKLGARVRPV